MTRISHLSPEIVDFIPEELEPGVLYISERFSTASHLCCCGCGLEVVTPLNPAKWSVQIQDGTVDLRPSVGNWSFPCKSHYWIDKGTIRWAEIFSAEAIAAVQRRDRIDADNLYAKPKSLWARIRAVWERIRKCFR